MASSTNFGVILLLSALLCAAAGTARAQGVGNPGALNGLQSAPPPFSGEALNNSLKGGAAPPTALPGASPQAPIAPPTKVPALMSPTDELFDAINRGDTINVRDALSRGADLNSRNELGMTPLDLSIDLGRNDISFLLLSMRASDSASTGPALAIAGKTGPARTRPVQRAARAARTRTRAADAHVTGQPSLPTLFANNGGAPVPQAGFLGFGGR